jgi:hypothetical protein
MIDATRIYHLYEGEWRYNMRWGHGYELFANGNYYEGAFRRDRPHGQGKFTSVTSGERYSGQWYQGMKHGFGIWLRNESPFCYAGFWMNNQPHGYGVLRQENGEIYEGKFINGFKHGTGQETFLNGN